eukprot:scaffold2880_cov173-Amphora_coffeaeformis.AAC.8
MIRMAKAVWDSISWKAKQRAIGEPHVATLVGNRSSTMTAADFAWQYFRIGLSTRPPLVQFRVVKVKIIQAVLLIEPYVMLFKD